MADTRIATSLDTPFDIARASALDGVPHGFFGACSGRYQFGYGGPGAVEELRAMRAAAAHAILPGAPLATPHQVHSPEVITLTKLWPDAPEGRPVGDAIVTRRNDVVIGIVTADCGPVLLADRNAGVVAAAHAGWRGAQGGVLENTIAAMQAQGAIVSRIVAAIGPTIVQASYEVDGPFRDHFEAGDAAHFVAAPVREGRPRWQFDLPGYIRSRLQRAGISQIEDMAQDTYAQPQRYHSYRRASQAGDVGYGRQLSAIAVSLS